MLSFLAVGTLWWFLLTIAAAVTVFSVVLNSRWIAGAFSILAYLSVLQWGSGVKVFDSVWSNPGMAALLIAVYIVAGVFWSFVRWWLYVRKWARVPRAYHTMETGLFSGTLEQYKEHCHKVMYKAVSKAESRAQNAGVSLDPDLPKNIEHWEKILESVRPKAVENKSEIATWILYWPLSVLISLFEDLLKEVARWIVERFKHIYEAISKSALKGVS